MSDPKEFDGDAPRLQRSQTADPRDPGIVRLLALLENATEGSRIIDWQIHELDVGDGDYYCPKYSTSLDAALTIAKSGWGWWEVGKVLAEDSALRHVGRWRVAYSAS